MKSLKYYKESGNPVNETRVSLAITSYMSDIQHSIVYQDSSVEAYHKNLKTIEFTKFLIFFTDGDLNIRLDLDRVYKDWYSENYNTVVL